MVWVVVIVVIIIVAVVVIVVAIAEVSKRTRNTRRRKKTWQLVYWIDLLWQYNDVFCGLKYNRQRPNFPFISISQMEKNPLFFTKQNEWKTSKLRQQQEQQNCNCLHEINTFGGKLFVSKTGDQRTGFRKCRKIIFPRGAENSVHCLHCFSFYWPIISSGKFWVK